MTEGLNTAGKTIGSINNNPLERELVAAGDTLVKQLTFHNSWAGRVDIINALRIMQSDYDSMLREEQSHSQERLVREVI